jgi:hypothetical protein
MPDNCCEAESKPTWDEFIFHYGCEWDTEDFLGWDEVRICMEQLKMLHIAESKPEPVEFTKKVEKILDDCKYGRVTNVEGSNAMIPLLKEACDLIDSLQEQLKAIESPCTYCKGTRRVEAFADNISLGWGRCPHCASDVLEGQITAKDKEIERLKATSRFQASYGEDRES